MIKFTDTLKLELVFKFKEYAHRTMEWITVKVFYNFVTDNKTPIEINLTEITFLKVV